MQQTVIEDWGHQESPEPEPEQYEEQQPIQQQQPQQPQQQPYDDAGNIPMQTW